MGSPSNKCTVWLLIPLTDLRQTPDGYCAFAPAYFYLAFTESLANARQA